MSFKDRLSKKTEGLIVPTKKEVATAAAQAGPKTGPGQMMLVRNLMKETNATVTQMEARLDAWAGALPVRTLDAKQIVASKWANRIDQNFDSVQFKQLRDEIAEAGGNVQPIKVRPLAGASDRYELVYGHRRHRACLELNLPVLALVADVGDQELFKEMDRENRARIDLSAWEQGMMYRRALTEKLFSSPVELAKQLGIDKGNLSKALRLAELPQAVVDAFHSPLELQFRWAKELHDALQADSQGVLVRAQQLVLRKAEKLGGKAVLQMLLDEKAEIPSNLSIVVNGKQMAEILTSDNRVWIKFEKGALTSEKTKRLHALLMEFLHS